MKSVKAIALVLIAIAAFVTTGFVLHDSLGVRPAIQFLPFQATPSEYSNARAREWHARLLGIGIGNGEAGAEPIAEESSIGPIDEMLIALALDEAELLSDPDLAALAARRAGEALDVALREGEAAHAVRLCLAFRWAPARLQSFAMKCRKTLARSGMSTNDSPFHRVQDGVMLVTPPKELREVMEAYLGNPYEPSAIHAVALELARAGHHEIAEKLCNELLQLDPELAAELQSELARIGGVSHESHDLDMS